MSVLLTQTAWVCEQNFTKNQTELKLN